MTLSRKSSPYGEPPVRATRNLVAGLAVSPVHAWLLFCAGLLATELGFLFWFRQVNLDEGWYLWASKLVYEGQLLYRDFAYTQTPLLPYVYGLVLQGVGAGLYQGRLLTVALAATAFALTAATAYRLAGKVAALGTLALIAASSFALAQYSYTATYALTAALVAGALYVAVTPLPESRRNITATCLLILAIGVRLSVGATLPFLLAYLLLTSSQRGRALVVLTATTVVALAVVVGLYWSLTGELMLYDVLGFHTDRLLKTEWQSLRIWHMSWRTLADFLVLIGLTVATAVSGVTNLMQAWRSRTFDALWRLGLFQLTIFAATAALFVVHALPRTTDSYYNSLQVPLMSLAGALLMARWLAGAAPARRPYLWFMLGLLVVAHGGRQWRALERDQAVVYPLRNQVAVVQSTAQLLRRFVAPGATLLSFNPHLALEAGLEVQPGYEMAIFAYRPTWSDEQTARYHVVNNQKLLADLRAGAAAVAMTSFDLEQIYGERDAVTAVLRDQYRWVASVPAFGPYGDELNLYLPPQFGAMEPQRPYSATLANQTDQIVLAGYDLDLTANGGAPVLAVALYWQTPAPPSRDYTVFVQLLDGEGAWAAGWDNPPCRTTCPTDTWRAGETIRDEYALPLSALAPGVYTLHAGMYDPANGVRMAVLDEHGEIGGDNVVLTEVELN